MRNARKVWRVAQIEDHHQTEKDIFKEATSSTEIRKGSQKPAFLSERFDPVLYPLRNALIQTFLLVDFDRVWDHIKVSYPGVYSLKEGKLLPPLQCDRKMLEYTPCSLQLPDVRSHAEGKRCIGKNDEMKGATVAQSTFCPAAA